MQPGESSNIINEPKMKYASGIVVFPVYVITNEGRKEVVKRYPRTCINIALKERDYLNACGHHSNIIVFYKTVEFNNHIHLLLEHCDYSLYDLLKQHARAPKPLWKPNNRPSQILLDLLSDMVCSIIHFHEKGICHGDLSPFSVLIVKNTSAKTKDKLLCAKLSPMSNSSTIGSDVSSSEDYTTVSGWQAPEQVTGGRQTPASDVYALGLVIFFCITKGCEYTSADDLNRPLVKNNPEAQDLLSRMLNSNAELRPTASEVLGHPFFYGSQKRMDFYTHASDRLELEHKHPRSRILGALESNASVVLGGTWNNILDRALVANIGPYRNPYLNILQRYNNVEDLVRVIRNKSGHYRQLPKNLKNNCRLKQLVER